MRPYSRHNTLLPVVLTLIGGGAGIASAAPLAYSAGHADMGLALHEHNGDTELEWHFHFDNSTTLDGGTPAEFEFAPEDAYVAVPGIASPPAAQNKYNPHPLSGEIGGGNTLWILSQVGKPGQPFLGLSTEEELGDASDWIGDFSITLDAFTGPAGGEFALWQSGSFGERNYKLKTYDGLGDSFTLPHGTHAHYNFGFAADSPGIWTLTLTGTGNHVEHGPLSATATFSFGVETVVPEPTSLALASLAAGTLLRRRRSDQPVSEARRRHRRCSGGRDTTQFVVNGGRG